MSSNSSYHSYVVDLVVSLSTVKTDVSWVVKPSVRRPLGFGPSSCILLLLASMFLGTIGTVTSSSGTTISSLGTPRKVCVPRPCDTVHQIHRKLILPQQRVIVRNLRLPVHVNGAQ